MLFSDTSQVQFLKALFRMHSGLNFQTLFLGAFRVQLFDHFGRLLWAISCGGSFGVSFGVSGGNGSDTEVEIN